jgi:hypothetical protein
LLNNTQNEYFDKYRITEKQRSDLSLSKETAKKPTSTGIDKEGSHPSASISEEEQMTKTRMAAADKKDSKPHELYLNSILDIDMIKDKSSSEISKIWLAYFAEKENTLSACMTGALYAKLRARSLLYPMVLEMYINA